MDYLIGYCPGHPGRYVRGDNRTVFTDDLI
jgi:hypothetical protein